MEAEESGNALDPEIAKLILEQSTDFICWADPDGVPQWVNEATQILDLGPNDIVGRHISDFVHPEQLARALESYETQARIAPGSIGTSTTFRLLTGSGEYQEFDVAGWPVRRGDKLEGMAIQTRPTIDSKLLRTLLTDLLSGRDPLDALSGLIELSFERSDGATCVLHVGNRSDDRLIGSKIEPVLAGIRPGGATHEPWRSARTDGQSYRSESLDELPAEVRRAAAKAGLGAVWIEPIVGPDGRRAGVLTAWMDAAGPPLAAIAYLVEVVPQIAAMVLWWDHQQRQLEDAANLDPLTRMANRRLVLDTLGRRLESRRDEQDHLSLIYIDLDHFKGVNDLHGHAIGDAVLIETARRLRLAVRDDDLVGRIGGDEFVVILSAPAEDADAAAHRIVDDLAREMALEGLVVKIGASAGVASARPDEDGSDLLQRADDALTLSKESGRGAVTHGVEALTIPHGSEGDLGDRIVSTAADLLAKIGPKRVTTRMVAQIAATDPASVLRLFESREEMLRAAMTRIATRHFENFRNEVTTSNVNPDMLSTDTQYWQALMRCVLDGEEDLATIEVEAGVSVPRHTLQDFADEAGLAEPDAVMHAQAVAFMSMHIGSMLVKELAYGLTGATDEARPIADRLIRETLNSLLTPPSYGGDGQ